MTFIIVHGLLKVNNPLCDENDKCIGIFLFAFYAMPHNHNIELLINKEMSRKNSFI